MGHGGARPGSGRKPGSKGRRLRQEAIEKAQMEGKLPHEFLLDIMRNPKENKERRIDAAKAAAPYYAPRLAAVMARVVDPHNAWVDIFALIDGKDRGLPTPLPEKPVLKLVDGTGPRAAPAVRGGKTPR